MAQHPAFDEFVDTIAALRAPDGCPWDREQTHESIAHNMLEEAYEAVDAIEAHDIAHLREELGDVLLQVVLQSQIARDAGEFDIDEVIADINDKIVRRHPHVFGQAEAGNANEVLELWDSIKLAEKSSLGGDSRNSKGHSKDEHGETAATVSRQGLLHGVPTSLPALMQAQKISRKAVSAGFEWGRVDDVWKQVFLEIDELKAAYEAAPKDAKGRALEKDAVELEMGDVLFTLVNVARKMGLDAESALRAGCAKFRRRWAFIEGAAWAQGKEVEELSLDEMEALWKEAKLHEHPKPPRPEEAGKGLRKPEKPEETEK
ncbi:MAG: nucleoside triphosphate pyrophosphohydrolase [Eggerthellaceae bacterium]|nr:nucleoside triphosphate pyrophosphohydrolase [Eggerthellaceae bacterium]